MKLPKHGTKHKPKAGDRFTPQSPRFPGIVAAARALGVTRHHLYFVLRGERKSPGLRRRYDALKSTQTKGAK